MIDVGRWALAGKYKQRLVSDKQGREEDLENRTTLAWVEASSNLRRDNFYRTFSSFIDFILTISRYFLKHGLQGFDIRQCSTLHHPRFSNHNQSAKISCDLPDHMVKARLFRVDRKVNMVSRSIRLGLTWSSVALRCYLYSLKLSTFSKLISIGVQYSIALL